MAILAFRTRPADPAGPTAQTVPPPRKPTLAVVSTGSKLCGIAAYTDALRRQLGDTFTITVFDLDQYLLRSDHRRVRKLADQHVKQICRELGRFDAVNLQLEHGTLGDHALDIYHRFAWLAAAAPRLSVTFHTLPLPAAFDYGAFFTALCGFRLPTLARVYGRYCRNQLLSAGIASRLRQAQRHKPVTAIVHTRRDASNVKYLYGVTDVLDHPLSFLSPVEADAVRNGASRRSLAMLKAVPDDAVLVGVFGFLNDYKGFGTAVRALHHLPDNHHLLIFGGIHPNDIALRRPIHPYLTSLFDEAYIDTSRYERIGRQRPPGAPRLILAADHCLDDLIGDHPRDLSARIHFMGAPDDRDFLAGMAICDAVVLPYLEVGQSASGPISQALELGCRVIASRTRTFLEFDKYHPETIEFFDIGNYLELAERILARRQFAARRALAFNVETNKAVYRRANTPCGTAMTACSAARHDPGPPVNSSERPEPPPELAARLTAGRGRRARRRPPAATAD